MIRVTITDRSVKRALAELAGRIQDRSTANKALSISLHKWVIDNFKTEGGKVGGWRELKPSTVRARLRKSRASKRSKRAAQQVVNAGGGLAALRAAKTGVEIKILQDTGNLRQSFAPFHDRIRAGVGARASFNVDYAKTHERGTARVPRRRMLPTQREAAPIGMKVYQRWIEQEIKSSGL